MTDRNACLRGRMSQRLIKSAGPEESRGAAGALSWSSRAWEKASRFIDREGLQLAPRSPPFPPSSPSSLLVPADGHHHCFIKIENRGPTHARARSDPYVRASGESLSLRCDYASRCRIEANRSIRFSVRDSMVRQVMSDAKNVMPISGASESDR